MILPTFIESGVNEKTREQPRMDGNVAIEEIVSQSLTLSCSPPNRKAATLYLRIMVFVEMPFFPLICLPDRPKRVSPFSKMEQLVHGLFCNFILFN